MLRTIDLRATSLSPTALRDALPRPEIDVSVAAETAATLIDDVRTRGADALRDQAERLDGGAPDHVTATADELAAARAGLAPDVRDALERMIERVRAGSAAQVPPAAATTLAPGATVTQRWQPVERVGLYVPGGKAVYPSSVVMNVVAAQAAGVRSIAIASPPQRAFGGAVHPTVLGAAALLGVREVHAMGGAGAIGALAYGVESLGIERVDVITGPGNVYVAAAKRIVQSVVGIDMEAGPTEILVIADASADPDLVASDLVSQAEHDEMAASVLVTDDADLADRIAERVAARAAATRHADRVAIALAGPQSAIVLVDDLAAAAAVSNAYGPEHLEIQTADDEAVLADITNAGAIFLGAHSPVSLGDYLAGSNHVLPTGGQSAHAAGLGAHTFLRPQQIIRYDAPALAEVADAIVALSGAEDLPAHGEAVRARTT
ncbi:histidinol dehydrogenase [Pseudoclavibacter chungangensis]|uniref:Histidinol dehydrogenase n=1 Tax=Pseudoclavibacter chungangensis TaxID=587635 RepID=A0A7J5BZN3_9MICO|nr:histidinol dehydrogenase [Pseudoclavibacter chungangensis]KAB1660117.1 histidinol dehydrogenase [Pseudoclavibacter chungangensis]NYJ66776.1 histidinol dehydrogenase [Pseudoclavibacter chungangensis]